MIKERLVSLCEYIKSKNDYFNAAYSDVVKDAINGKVRDEKGNILLPMDNAGNYFYLRSPDQFKPTYIQGNMYMSGQITLVAYCINADRHTLADNLIETLYESGCAISGDISIDSILVDFTDVLKKEIGTDKATESAAQRFGETLISIIFTNNFPWTKTCIQNPCKTC